MSNVEIENDSFACHRESDFVILTLKQRAQKILTTVDIKNELLSHLAKIESSSDIRGLALIDSEQYPGDREYKSLLNDMLSDIPDEARKRFVLRYKTAISQILEIIFNFPIPIVAGMNGNIEPDYFGFYMAFDFRIASKNTYFTNPNLKFGYPPSSLLSFFLVKNLGPTKAIELLLSHSKFSAEKAYRLGLITQIIDEDKIELQCIEKLNELSSLSKYSVAETRRLLQPNITEFKKHMDAMFDSSVKYIHKRIS